MTVVFVCHPCADGDHDQCAGMARLCTCVEHDSPARNGRPAMGPFHAWLYDRWLIPNGIVGWIPEHAEIVVEDGRITYPAWQHLDGTVGGWGHDILLRSDVNPDGGDIAVEVEQTVPVIVPVDDEVRLLAEIVGLRIVEQGG